MKLADSSVLMAMTSRMKDGKRQGLTISSKLMADYLEKRVKKLKVIDQPLRNGWTHYPAMMYDLYKAFKPAFWKPWDWDLFVAFDVINGLAGTMAAAKKLCYAVDDQARPHGKFVSWLYRKMDAYVRSNSDIVLESSPNATKGSMVMPSLCPPLVEEHYKPKEEPIVGYLGALEKSFGVDKAILAMRLILEAAPDATMEIVGSGPERMKLEDLARGLPIRFYGFLPDEEAIEVVKRWRVGLAPYTEAMKDIDSGKIKFYGWAGVPSVVSTDVPAMVKMMTDFGTGIPANPEPEELAKAVFHLFIDESLYAKCLSGCRRLAEAFESTPYFDKLFAAIP